MEGSLPWRGDPIGEKNKESLSTNRLLSPTKLLRSNPSFTKIAPDGFLHSHPNLQGATSVTFGSLSIVAHSWYAQTKLLNEQSVFYQDRSRWIPTFSCQFAGSHLCHFRLPLDCRPHHNQAMPSILSYSASPSRQRRTNTPWRFGCMGIDSKAEHILPIIFPEKNEEIAHFDVHSVGFLALKNATKMADTNPLLFLGYCRPKDSCPVAMMRGGLFPCPWPIRLQKSLRRVRSVFIPKDPSFPLSRLHHHRLLPIAFPLGQVRSPQRRCEIPYIAGPPRKHSLPCHYYPWQNSR